MHATINPSAFFEGQAEVPLVRLPPKEAKILRTALGQVTPRLPVIDDARASFNASASYSEFDFKVKYLFNNYIGVVYYYAHVTFEPRWANPLWELMDADITRELDSIQGQLKAAVKRAHFWPHRFVDIDASQMSNVSVLPPSAFRLWR